MILNVGRDLDNSSLLITLSLLVVHSTQMRSIRGRENFQMWVPTSERINKSPQFKNVGLVHKTRFKGTHRQTFETVVLTATTFAPAAVAYVTAFCRWVRGNGRAKSKSPISVTASLILRMALVAALRECSWNDIVQVSSGSWRTTASSF